MPKKIQIPQMKLKVEKKNLIINQKYKQQNDRNIKFIQPKQIGSFQKQKIHMLFVPNIQ